MFFTILIIMLYERFNTSLSENFCKNTQYFPKRKGKMKIFYLLLLRIHHGFDVGIDLRETVFAELDELLGFL